MRKIMLELGSDKSGVLVCAVNYQNLQCGVPEITIHPFDGVAVKVVILVNKNDIPASRNF